MNHNFNLKLLYEASKFFLMSTKIFFRPIFKKVFE